MKKLILIVLLSSCASKKQSSVSRNHFEKLGTEQMTLQTQKQAQHDQNWYRDSTVLAEQLLIYPEGSIQIGPSGFVGEAKAVVWLRRQQQQREVLGSSTVTAEKLQRNEEKGSASLSKAEAVSKTTSIGFTSLRWGIIGTLVVLGLAYRYWHKR